MVQGKLTFVSGGVRSGKSAFAEKLLTRGGEERLVYIASGVASDSEMQERIRQHQEQRKGDGWLTVEQPVRLSEALEFIRKGDRVLWDCLTTWLANELYEGWEDGTPCIGRPGCMEKKTAELLETVRTITDTASKFVIVSNEVLDEPASLYEETCIYASWIGRLHQEIVKIADDAVEMEYGMPVYWKKDGEMVFK